MSKDRIKGFLIGDPIDITCTKNQGKLLRVELADWFDEDMRTSEETGTVPFTEKDIKAYLDECIVFWRKKRANPLIKEQSRIRMAEHYVDAFQSVRVSLFGGLLPVDNIDSLKEDYECEKQLNKLELAKENKKKWTEKKKEKKHG